MAITRINNNQITDAIAGNLYVGINAATKLQNYSITSQKISNNLTYGSDLIIAGNLTVQGNVTAIDTIDLVVEDPLILLAKDQTGSPTLDIGFIGERGSEINIAFIWDEGSSEFATVYTNDAITNTVVTIDSYASLHVANITASNANITGNVAFSGNIVGDLSVTGNVDAGNLNSDAAVTGVTVTASGNLQGNNATITNGVSGATVTASGNILGGNVNSNAAVTGVTITASGNLNGGNAVITGAVSAATGSYTGNIIGGNLNSNAAVTGTTITASGNLVGGNANITNAVNTATVNASGNVLAGNLNSNAAVTGVTVTASGNLVGANANITNGVYAATGNFSGNVSADYYFGNGSQLTGVAAASAGFPISNGTSNLNAIVNGNIAVTVSGTSNVAVFTTSGVEVSGTVDATTVVATGNLAGANANITNGVYAATGNYSGNVSANYFFGNGSQLTGIDATQISSGNSNIKISTANGNAVVNISGTSNVVVITTNSVEVAGAVNASGNVLAGNVNSNAAVTAVSVSATTVTASGNLVGGNANITGAVNTATVSASGNIVGGNVQSTGLVSGTTVSASGNLVGGNANITNGVYAATGSFSGNVSVANLNSTGAVNSSTVGATTITASGNLVGGNANITNAVNATTVNAGNVNGGNINTNNVVGTEITLTGDNVNFVLTGNIRMNQSHINNLADPVRAFDAATKQYVDDAVSAGLTIHTPVYVEAPSALTATYTQGGNTFTVTDTVAANTVVFSTAANLQTNDQLWFTSAFSGILANVPYFVVSAPNTSAAVLSTSFGGDPVANITSATGLSQSVRVNSGIGATLTNSAANAQLQIDGITLSGGERVLIYTQANSAQNGVYVVTDAGNVSAAWVLTRSSDTNTYGPSSINALDAGDYFFVQAGDTGAGESYVMTSPTGPIIIGYTGLTFTQFSASSTYSAGNGLSLNGTTFNVNVDNDTTAIVADQVVVKTGANLVTPNIGDATGNSLTLGGNGLLSATTVSATGNVSGGNVNVTSGVYTATVSATGNVLGGNINSNAAVTGVTITGTTVTATGNLVGGNANITNAVNTATVNASGNVLAGNLNSNAAVTGVTITASGNLNGGNAVITGAVSAATGSFSGNVIGGNINSNAAVTGVTVTASGNLNGGNAVITGAVSSATVSASGNIVGGNVNSSAAVTGVTVTASGNLNGNNAVITNGISAATGSFTGNISAGNASVTGNVSGTGAVFSGNVTAAYFIGNVSGNISGNVTAGGSNTQIQFNDQSLLNGSSAFTFDKTSNLVTVTGNLSAGNLSTAGSTTTATVNASGNIVGANINSNAAVTAVTVTASGNLNGGNAVVTGDVGSATVTASGNVLAGNLNSNAAVTGVTVTATGNLVGGNANITNAVNSATVTATGNVAGGNITTAGQVVATGNVTGGNINTAAGVYSATITATGNITGGNITTAGQANLGNIRISGDTITGTNGQVLVNSAGDDVNFIVSGDTVANLLVADAGSDTVLIGTGTPTTNAALKIGTTNSILLPVGNTAQRPGTPATGMLRFNTSLDVLEFYDSNSWTPASSEFTVITADEFTGDGSTVAFTLTIDSTTAGTIVAINGVVQIPTTAYSISNNILTFTEAPETGDAIDVRILTTTTTVASITNGSGNAAVEALNNAAVQITGNLIPAANITYDLGSTTNFWNDLYLAGNSIYLGTIVIKDVGANQIGFFQADGTTPATIDANNVDTTQIADGTSNAKVSTTNGNITMSVAGTSNVMVVASTGVQITGDLSVTGNATLSGNILGDRVQNGTTSLDIQTQNGNANISVGGVSNVAVFSTAGANITGALGVTGNITGSYLFGNGSQLTGIDATQIQNGTANVRAFQNGNVTVSAAGTANVLVVTSSGVNVAGTMNLSVSSTVPAVQITQTGAGNAILIEDSASPDSSPFVIDGSGRVLVGYTTSVAVGPTGPYQVQISSNSAGPGMSLTNYSNSTAATHIVFAKGRSDAIGTFGAVANGDVLGQVFFYGASGNPDATQSPSPAGSIEMLVDGAPGFYSTPGRLIFKTTRVGAAGSSERLRIDNVGNISATGNLIAANIFANTNINTSVLTATGNISGSNLNVTGNIVDTGALSLITGASGNINLAPNGTNMVVATTTGANIAGTLDATGNITGGNLLTAGLISATGNITTGANIVAIGGAGRVTLATDGGGAVNIGRIDGVASTPYIDFNSSATLVDYDARIQVVGNTGTAGGGTLTVTAATLAASAAVSAVGNITGGNLSVSTGTVTLGNVVNANGNGVGNIGSATTYFNTVFAKATSAQYADLAEMYEADMPIEPGTVVCFGGAKEVTLCEEDACRRIAGVVSTNPSYLMNSGQTGEYVVAIALQGRVPVKVTGVVRKGDMMVATSNGRARAEANPQVGAVIGKALADFDGQDGVIEVVIGRI